MGILAQLLRTVHCRVCLIDQLFAVQTFTPINSNADAGGHTRSDITEHEGRGYRRDDALGNQPCTRGMVKRSEQGGEFVASQPCHRIGVALAIEGNATDFVILTQGHTDTHADLLQQTVADLMAKAVVNRLETIQVEEQQRHNLLVARRTRQNPAHLLDEMFPSRQAGEAVKLGAVLHFEFSQLALCEILDVDDDAGDTRLIAQISGRCHEMATAQFPVLRHEFNTPYLPRDSDNLDQPARNRIPRLFACVVRQDHPGQLRLRHTEYARIGRRRIFHAQIPAQQHHRI